MGKLSDSLLQGAKEALAYAKNKQNKAQVHRVCQISPDVDVKAIRQKMNLTRVEFAERFGFSVRTLEKWEQGVRRPDTSTRAYLIVIGDAPEQVMKSIKSHRASIFK